MPCVTQRRYPSSRGVRLESEYAQNDVNSPIVTFRNATGYTVYNMRQVSDVESKRALAQK
jgi:hypothetical protein